MRSRYRLHSFTLGDVEDVEIYAAQYIYDWQQTSEGKFCMEKATDIEWQTMIDPSIFGHRIIITGWLEDKHATFWALKKS